MGARHRIQITGWVEYEVDDQEEVLSAAYRMLEEQGFKEALAHPLPGLRFGDVSHALAAMYSYKLEFGPELPGARQVDSQLNYSAKPE